MQRSADAVGREQAMGEKEVGFGVVGLGMGAARCRSISKTEGARLVAVCDINEERGRKAQEEHGCVWLRDYDDLLKREDIEVVLVMTPSGLHADMGIAAARAGKHVVTTKPIDVTLEKADALIAACREAGVILAVDFNQRYSPDVWKVKHAIGTGAFGRLILGETHLKWFRSAAYFGGGWRGTWAMDGGGSLMNQTVHGVDLLQWFMGPVRSVYGRMGIFAHDIETEDLTVALLRFANGAVGTILSTTTFPVDKITRTEVHGDRGGAILSGAKIEFWMTKASFDEGRREENPQDFPYEYTGPRNVAEEMVRLVRQGGKPIVSGEEARKSLEIILAVYQSARQGREVTLPLASA